jgi:hypothetical protein
VKARVWLRGDVLGRSGETIDRPRLADDAEIAERHDLEVAAELPVAQAFDIDVANGRRDLAPAREVRVSIPSGNPSVEKTILFMVRSPPPALRLAP